MNVSCNKPLPVCDGVRMVINQSVCLANSHLQPRQSGNETVQINDSPRTVTDPESEAGSITA